MKEADFQTRFGKWLKSEDGAWASGVFELKLARGKRIAWRVLEEHQERALLQATGSAGVYYKLSDLSFGSKPFDCFMTRNASAWVVVGWMESSEKGKERLLGWTMTRVAEWVRLRVEKRARGLRGGASVTCEELKGQSIWIEC